MIIQINYVDLLEHVSMATNPRDTYMHFGGLERCCFGPVGVYGMVIGPCSMLD